MTTDFDVQRATPPLSVFQWLAWIKSRLALTKLDPGVAEMTPVSFPFPAS